MLDKSAIPSYWRTAIKRSWDTFSLHTGVAGAVLPIVIVAIGYAVGAREETIGAWKGAAGGFAVAAIYYTVILLVVTPRQLWNDAQQQLTPKLDLCYDGSHSLICPPDHETYRIKVTNLGVKAIDDVEVRIIAAPTLRYLDGYLPMVLREQHYRTGPPFTLKGDTPRYFDFLECSEKLSATIVNNGAQLVLFCHDLHRAHHASFSHAGENVIEVEVSGRDVPPCRKSFTVHSLLPERRKDGASLEITETV